MSKLIVSNRQLPSIREGIIKGLEISSGAKSSATYYHKREDQIAAVKAAVEKLYGISKELPLLLAAQDGSTGFFIQEVLKNELSRGERGGACNVVNPQVWYDEGLGAKVTEHVLYTLDRQHGIPYVLRLLTSFKDEKINNARSRHMALRFILGHPNLEYVAVKYRTKMQEVLTHVYGVKKAKALVKIARNYVERDLFNTTYEANTFRKNVTKYGTDAQYTAKIFLFLMGEGYPEYYGATEFPVLSQFYRAKSSIEGCVNLPAEVLLGIVSDKAHPQFTELWGSEAKRKRTQKKIREMVETTTANQAMRQTKKNAELGVNKAVEIEEVTDFLALYKTGYENGFTDTIRKAITDLAQKKRFKDFLYEKVGVVVDTSTSMGGHRTESKNTPRAIASFTAEVLSASADTTVKTTGTYGSDVATAFLDLVDDGEYDAIFVISDGYENAYDGLFNEVVQAWRSASDSTIPIYHVSPVTGSEVGAKVRSFGDQISTIAVNGPGGLVAQMTSKLLEQDIVAWLGRQVRNLGEVRLPRTKASQTV